MGEQGKEEDEEMGGGEKERSWTDIKRREAELCEMVDHLQRFTKRRRNVTFRHDIWKYLKKWSTRVGTS